MTKDKQKKLNWEVEEHSAPKRSMNWYIIASVILLLILFFCFFTIKSWHLVFLGASSNFLFAFILIVASAIMMVHERQTALKVKVELDVEGITVGYRFYDYDDIKTFSIIFKPKNEVKNLYLEFKNILKPRLSIPLEEMSVLEVRDFLLKYLDEDLDRTDPPVSEQLTKLLKL